MSGSLSATPKYIYHDNSTAYREANKYDLVVQENRTAAAEVADNQTMHTSRYRLTTWDRRQGRSRSGRYVLNTTHFRLSSRSSRATSQYDIMLQQKDANEQSQQVISSALGILWRQVGKYLEVFRGTHTTIRPYRSLGRKLDIRPRGRLSRPAVLDDGRPVEVLRHNVNSCRHGW